MSISNDNGQFISQSEWVKLYAIPTLTKKQRETYNLMRDGYILIVDQYTNKSWLEKNGEMVPVRNNIGDALYELHMLETHSEVKSATTDLYNHKRRYVRTGFRLIHGI